MKIKPDYGLNVADVGDVKADEEELKRAMMRPRRQRDASTEYKELELFRGKKPRIRTTEVERLGEVLPRRLVWCKIRSQYYLPARMSLRTRIRRRV